MLAQFVKTKILLARHFPIRNSIYDCCHNNATPAYLASTPHTRYIKYCSLHYTCTCTHTHTHTKDTIHCSNSPFNKYVTKQSGEEYKHTNQKTFPVISPDSSLVKGEQTGQLIKPWLSLRYNFGKLSILRTSTQNP